MTVDEAIDAIEQSAALAEEDQLRAAIDLLSEAVARPTGQPAADIEVKLQLGTFLHLAEEHTRAAAVLVRQPPFVIMAGSGGNRAATA